MKFNEGGGEFEEIPLGTHNAMLVGIYDLGMQKNKFRPDDPAKPTLVLHWILDVAKQSDGSRFEKFEVQTNSLHEKANLTERIGALTGDYSPEADAFDPVMLLGRCAEQIYALNKGGKPGIKRLNPTTSRFELTDGDYIGAETPAYLDPFFENDSELKTSITRDFNIEKQGGAHDPESSVLLFRKGDGVVDVVESADGGEEVPF